jgi:hypothetical protein
VHRRDLRPLKVRSHAIPLQRRSASCGTAHLVSEVDCWSQASKSLASLSNFYANSEQIIGRVNRLIAVWPTDDVLPAEGYEHLKTNYKKLSRALKDVRDISEDEAKYANFCASPKSVTSFVSAIDSVLEKLDVLIALRQAPESLPQGKIVTPSIISRQLLSYAPFTQRSETSARGHHHPLPLLRRLHRL